jgi:DNA-binding LytR/AlgR family response regulator
MKVLIIEDEYLAARHLQRILKDIDDIQVVAVVESITETVEWWSKNHQPDLVFMDIHLADGSAFEIFKLINLVCPIIFTTAYDKYALNAFKVNSIDYLLKPVDKQMVEKALNKLRTISHSGKMQHEISRLISSFVEKPVYKTHFLVPVKGSKLIPLLAKDISFIHIENGVVKARTLCEKTYVIENTLDELIQELNPNDFFRANRQFIISRDSIKEVDLWFNNRLSISLKVTVPEKILISKTRMTEFKQWYSGKSRSYVHPKTTFNNSED